MRPKLDRLAWYFDIGYCELTGKDHPDTFIDDWNRFLNEFEAKIKNNVSMSVDFIVDYYGSSSSRFVTAMFNLLSDNCRKCKPIVNWHYFEADWTTQENGEIWAEQNPRVKVNFVIRKE